MFNLLRYYSVASLGAVLITALALTWLYRQASILGIVDLTERSTLLLAREAVAPVKNELIGYLDATADIRPELATPRLPVALSDSIKALMRDGSVARIKIYNARGVVVFSTSPAQIGDDQSRNPGFLKAIRGVVASNLVYRDTFNQFDGETEEDNLAQTYVPVRSSPSDSILGVFEIYTDVNRMVLLTERTEFIIMIGSTLVLAALYVMLQLIVRRAGHLIESQQRTIRDRTDMLEMLSAQMLKSEESHKKKIAVELHEGLAQTLAALKLKAESGTLKLAEDDATMPSQDSIIPLLQAAIQEVREIATELRPSILDDFGLLPTINWLCRRFEQQHPDIVLGRSVSVREDEVTVSLKIVIYRIIASAFDDLVRYDNPQRIHIALWREHGVLTLLIDDTPNHLLDETAHPLRDFNRELRSGLARIEELTTLSGGTFTASYRHKGSTILRAAWNV